MATLGQTIAWNASVADDGSTDLDPASNSIGVTTSTSTEAMVQAVIWEVGNNIELYHVDGSGNEFKFMPPSTGSLDLGSIEHRAFRVRDNHFLRIYNRSGATIRIKAEGSIIRD